MSKAYRLTSQTGETSSIAHMISTGTGTSIVRFAFPEVLFIHVSHIELTGDDGCIITIGELFSQATTVDFDEDGCGAECEKPYTAYEQKKDTWEMT